MNANIQTPYGLKEAVGVKLSDMQLPIWQRRQITPKFTRNGYGADDPAVLDMLIVQEKRGESYLVNVDNADKFGLTEEQFYVAIGSEKTCVDCDALHEVDKHVVVHLKALDEANQNRLTDNGQQIYDDRMILPPGRMRYNKGWKSVQFEKRHQHPVTVEEVVAKQAQPIEVERGLVTMTHAEARARVQVTSEIKVVGHINLPKPVVAKKLVIVRV